MMRPKPKPPEEEMKNFIHMDIPTKEEIVKRHLVFCRDAAKADRVMFLEYLNQGFTEDQAIQLLVSRLPYVVRM